jgi:hypothetical protein
MRIVGKPSYLQIADKWVGNLSAFQNKKYGQFADDEGPFQLEFLDRNLVSYMQMIKDGHPLEWQKAFQVAWGNVEWNTYYADYCYYWSDSLGMIDEPVIGWSGASFADMTAWMAFETQHRPFVRSLNKIWVGQPYFNVRDWSGDWIGRYVVGFYQNFFQKPGLDTTPPPKITNLSGTALDWGVKLSFTTPAGARKYHAVWGYNPIKEGPDSLHLDTLKWWQAYPGGVMNTARAAGSVETLTVNLPLADTTFYFAVRAFDSLNNISDISNVYSLKANIISVEMKEPEFGKPALLAYPNPFNPAVRIKLVRLPQNLPLSIRIYDLSGRIVRDFTHEIEQQGQSRTCSFTWDAGKKASGIYIIKARAGNLALQRKILLVK